MAASALPLTPPPRAAPLARRLFDVCCAGLDVAPLKSLFSAADAAMSAIEEGGEDLCAAVTDFLTRGFAQLCEVTWFRWSLTRQVKEDATNEFFKLAFNPHVTAFASLHKVRHQRPNDLQGGGFLRDLMRAMGAEGLTFSKSHRLALPHFFRMSINPCQNSSPQAHPHPRAIFRV